MQYVLGGGLILLAVVALAAYRMFSRRVETAPPASVRGPVPYQATTLEVRPLLADVTVQPFSAATTIDVGISGPDSVVSGIEVKCVDGRLTLSQQQDRLYGDFKFRPLVQITVPPNTNVTVHAADGDTLIGDIRSAFTGKVCGSGCMRVGKVRDATLTVRKQGRIVTQRVQGTLDCSVHEGGEIMVQDGEVTQLKATVMHDGKVTYHGNAREASLTITGDGEITASHVTNKPRRNVIGAGTIVVENW